MSLLTSHQAALRLYVSSLLPGEAASADVAQQANATIWRKRTEFELGTNFKAWIFAIARYEVLNFRKKQARDSRLVFSGELEEIMAEELPRHSDDLEDRQAALRGCLAGLKKPERELILHRYYHRTPLKKYSAAIGRPVGSLKVSLHRIRGKLAGCVESKLASGRAGA